MLDCVKLWSSSCMNHGDFRSEDEKVIYYNDERYFDMQCMKHSHSRFDPLQYSLTCTN